MAAPRFVVDVNVGRLGKWLRAMGYDALFVPDVDDADLLEIARRESRILLTRDTHLLERRAVTTGGVRAVLVKGDHLAEQIQHVASVFGLEASQDFVRCIECNAPLHGIGKAVVSERVPPHVFKTQDTFKECPTCHKVYWRGTHWRNMKREMARALGEQA